MAYEYCKTCKHEMQLYANRDKEIYIAARKFYTPSGFAIQLGGSKIWQSIKTIFQFLKKSVLPFYIFTLLDREKTLHKNALFLFAPHKLQLFSYGSPIGAPISSSSSYGSPSGTPISSSSSYGSPHGKVITNTYGAPNSPVNPRLPSGRPTIYSASGDAARASSLTHQNPFVTPSPGADDSFSAPKAPNKITLTEPGYDGWVWNHIHFWVWLLVSSLNMHHFKHHFCIVNLSYVHWQT